MSVKSGICETLFYVQRSQYNKLYYARTVLSYFYVLSLTADDAFPWHEDIMKHVRMFFQVISIPIFTLQAPYIYVFWAIVMLFILLTASVFVAVARGLIMGDLERKYLGTVVRITLGIAGTFWITIARTLYVQLPSPTPASVMLLCALLFCPASVLL
jgi:hypothetical protein